MDVQELGYDIINWEVFKSLMKGHTNQECSCVPYRFDAEKGVIYTYKNHVNARYTYIAKADGLDVYKIGHTSNLERRMKDFSNQKPYSLLRLKAIAYCLNDIEFELLLSIKDRSRKLPPPYDKKRELVILKKQNVQRIINQCGFITLGENDSLPTCLTTIRRIEYDPNSGRFLRVEDKYELEPVTKK